MTMPDDSAAQFHGRAFQCPHCKHVAKQNWGQAISTQIKQGSTTHYRYDVSNDEVWFSKCDGCENILIWKSSSLVWPAFSTAPESHPDFPEEIRQEYEEARQIYNASPRASAALLRLCLQKLCKILGAKGDNINNDIQHLYDEYGLGRRVRDSMDILRIVGNNAVHPGEISFEDNREISLGLFRIINFVVDKAISEPAHIDSIFTQLPEGARKAIEIRDARSASSGKPLLGKPQHQN